MALSTATPQPAFLRLPRTLPAALLPEAMLEHARQLWTSGVLAAQQAAGLPTAPHAAFKPYAIDAVTIQLPSPPPGVRKLLCRARDDKGIYCARPPSESPEGSSCGSLEFHCMSRGCAYSAGSN